MFIKSERFVLKQFVQETLKIVAHLTSHEQTKNTVIFTKHVSSVSILKSWGPLTFPGTSNFEQDLIRSYYCYLIWKCR